MLVRTRSRHHYIGQLVFPPAPQNDGVGAAAAGRTDVDVPAAAAVGVRHGPDRPVLGADVPSLP